jgi:hypothetical protein
MARNVCGPSTLPIQVYLAIPNGVGYEANFKSISSVSLFRAIQCRTYQSLIKGGSIFVFVCFVVRKLAEIENQFNNAGSCRFVASFCNQRAHLDWPTSRPRRKYLLPLVA